QLATPIQQKAIPKVLKGRDLMGCAQTGTGKTAAFALPTLERLGSGRKAPHQSAHGKRRVSPRPIRALVLAPTRELAKQIAESFTVYGRFTGLRNTVVFGGVRQAAQVRSLQAGVDILVATPGRLLDLIGQGFVNLARVQILILDEADQMLDMGFLPDLRKIVAHVPRERQTLMFSATMPDAIRQLAAEWLSKPICVQAAPVATPAENVHHEVYSVERHNKSHLLAGLLQLRPTSRTLVFSRTKHGADKIARYLQRIGISAIAIHGDKSQGTRDRALQQFKSQLPPVLVATDVAARGLDIDGVACVVNYDLPEVPEMYVHRIGRTARAGASGRAVSFCSREEQPRWRRIESLTKLTIEIKKAPVELSRKEPPPPRPGAKSRMTPPSAPRYRPPAQSKRRKRRSNRATA
ncbi:MAG: DEAD/DEAH box helicase, partial [Pirellulaceae bacterium]